MAYNFFIIVMWLTLFQCYGAVGWLDDGSTEDPPPAPIIYYITIKNLPCCKDHSTNI